MNKNKILKEFIDRDFFELPKKSFDCLKYSFKFGWTDDRVEDPYPHLYICNKTSVYDKFLIGKTFKFNYLILKDEIVKQIYDGTLPKHKLKSLLNHIKILYDAFISIVIFPERNQTVFGDTGFISKNMTDFLLETKFDIRFFSLIGTYFSAPIWTNDFRKCTVSYRRQFEIKYNDAKNMSSEKFNDKVNEFMPSSASVYTKKVQLGMLSTKRAQNLETIVYCCPNCKKFFSIYSERNCIKCNNCQSAVELLENGDIILTKNVHNFDELNDFQYKELSKLKFTNKPIISYPTANLCTVFDNNSINIIGDVKLDIYQTKIQATKNDYNKTIEYHDVREIEFAPSNTLIIYLSDGNKIGFVGKNKENLYIISDLFKNFKEKTAL